MDRSKNLLLALVLTSTGVGKSAVPVHETGIRVSHDVGKNQAEDKELQKELKDIHDKIFGYIKSHNLQPDSVFADKSKKKLIRRAYKFTIPKSFVLVEYVENIEKDSIDIFFWNGKYIIVRASYTSKGIGSVYQTGVETGDPDIGLKTCKDLVGLLPQK